MQPHDHMLSLPLALLATRPEIIDPHAFVAPVSAGTTSYHEIMEYIFEYFSPACNPTKRSIQIKSNQIKSGQ
jgi:hypothetical protein